MISRNAFKTELDKPGCLLQHRYLLSCCWMSGGHRLPGFLQGSLYSFPQPPPGEAVVLWPRQGVHRVGGDLPDPGQASITCLQTDSLAQGMSPGTDTEPCTIRFPK